LKGIVQEGNRCHIGAAVTVTEPPVSVAGPELIAKLMGNPEEAPAVSSKGASP